MESGRKVRYVYADNAATTQMRELVLNKMLPYLTEFYGNPSSIYKIGGTAKKAVEDSRNTVAKILNVLPREIYFTSGGTEANNWAIKGIASANKKKGRHIITSKIEHHAVLRPCEELEKQDFELSYLGVDKTGLVSVDELKNEIRDDTVLVSIMAANNEIGTIQSVNEIGKICHEKGVLFHTDAVQAVGHIPIDTSNIDLLSLSAHKFGGPKGVGVLYIKKGVKVNNIIDGGGQERDKRSGTENVASIVGLAAALELASGEIESESKRLCEMRNEIIKKVLTIDKVYLTGSSEYRLPGIASFIIEGIEGESIVLTLEAKGISSSSGSACSTASLDPSHVLTSIGLPHEAAHGSLRLSFGKNNTIEDVDYIFEALKETVEKLRKMSPVWNGGI